MLSNAQMMRSITRRMEYALPLTPLAPPVMILVTSNPQKRLLLLTYSGRIQPADVRQSLDEIRAQLPGLTAGFHLLVDFSFLETMELACAPEIGVLMETMDAAGVSLVVRVMPDPKKDIGMNILTLFHYRHPLKVLTCPSLAEAMTALA